MKRSEWFWILTAWAATIWATLDVIRGPRPVDITPSGEAFDRDKWQRLAIEREILHADLIAGRCSADEYRTRAIELNA